MKPGSSSIGSIKREEGVPRIGARDDRGGGDLGAVGERDAGDGAVVDEDSRDGRAGANLGAGLARGVGHRARDRAGPAHRGHAAAAGQRIDRGGEQQHRAGAGRPRPHRGAVNAARGDRRLQQIALEPFGDEIGDRHRAPAQQREAVAFAERAEAASRLGELPQVSRPAARRSTAASCRAARRGSGRRARAWRRTRGSARRPSPRTA